MWLAVKYSTQQVHGLVPLPYGSWVMIVQGYILSVCSNAVYWSKHAWCQRVRLLNHSSSKISVSQRCVQHCQHLLLRMQAGCSAYPVLNDHDIDAAPPSGAVI
eukprot:GHUV01004935.1.p1 GENE.GHUV01004935.1~~GHUV01004935.1.p1  ORF type:complete len:103 (+),score=22.35 GHUV01004935.1:595-903(+)